MGGRDVEAAKQQCMATIRASLRPELLNRLDDIIVFNPLAGQALQSVVRLLLSDVSKRLHELDIRMTITDAAVDHVLREAYDPELGARPLRRYLEKHVVSALSRQIVAGNLTAGCSVSVHNDSRGLQVHTVSNGLQHRGVEEEAPLMRSDSVASKRTASDFTSRSESNHLLRKRSRT